MDEFELPDDLKDDVEIVYLEEGEEIEGMEDFQDDADLGEENNIEIQVVDMSKLTFKKHQGSVFNCDISKDQTILITGGEDDMAYLWNIASGEIIFECTGHKDSITEVGFNHDDQYVVTGDMAGLLQVWNIKEKKLTWCYEGDDLTWLTWHHMANVLMSGSQAGDVYVFQIPQGNCKVLPTEGSPAFCGKLLPDGKRLLVGYGDGKIKLWDIKSAAVVWQFTNAKMDAINNIDISNDGALLCASSSGELIKLADGKLINTLLTEGETEIEISCFDTDLGIIVTGALSGQICVWDVGRQVIRHQAKIECSVTCIKFGKGGKLFIGAVDGAIYVCDARSGLLIDTLTGHESGILSLSVSKNGDFILTTSDDGTAKIFVVPE